MESGNDIPVLFWPFMVLVLTYLGAIFYLLSHLRRAHNPVWIDLGSLSLTSFFGKRPFQTFLGQFRLLGFLFGGRYKSLADPKVVTLIWAIRLMFVAAFVLWAFVMFPLLEPGPPR